MFRIFKSTARPIFDLALRLDGADVNAMGAKGFTALHWSVSRGDVEMASALLAADGIDVNAPDDLGRPPLGLAVINVIRTIS